MNKRLTRKNETREKRKSQTCKVYEVKIDHSHLSLAAQLKCVGLGSSGGGTITVVWLDRK